MVENSLGQNIANIMRVEEMRKFSQLGKTKEGHKKVVAFELSVEGVVRV